MIFIKTNDDKRITCVTTYRPNMVCYEDEIELENLPNGITLNNVHDYLYIDGEFIYDPVPVVTIEEPTVYDKLEAQVLYTAMMTDTLMED
ncbi:MAG: hypothetical protein E7270_11620 [Lachnospiraceae bacterium]|nr:hypothetical protein [Lachnospiraceae bacterium]